MKAKLSITIEKDLEQEAEKVIEEGRFRNKSHLLEYALKSFLKDKERTNKKMENFQVLKCIDEHQANTGILQKVGEIK